MEFFDIIRNLYIKNKQLPEITNGMLIILNKWLSWDKNNLKALHRLLPYLFYIEPLHYYYLLFFNIPKKPVVPFLKKIDIKEKEKDELINKIQYVLGWSNKELSHNIDILRQVILPRKEYWKEELGL
jgi:hypothetical protein